MPPLPSLKSALLTSGFVWFATQSAFAQSYTNVNWTRTSDGNWSVNTHWTPNTAMTNNGFYYVQLGANSGSGSLVLNNDLTGLTLSRLAIEGPSVTTAYELNGQALTLTGNIVNRGTKSLTINVDLTFLNAISNPTDGGRLRLHAGDSGTLDSFIHLNGVISGAGDSYAFLSGAKTIFYGGIQPNTFVGSTVVDGGTLVLNKSAGVNAIAGPLRIRVPSIVRLGNSNQIDDSVTLSFGQPGSRFQLAGFEETLGNIVSEIANAGIIENAANTPGTLTLSSSTDILFEGSLQNGTGSGGLNLVKSGTNTLTLNGNSSYTGTTKVNQGTLLVGHANALGTGGNATSMTTVAADAKVIVKDGITVTNEWIELHGAGGSDNSGALRSDSVSGGTSTWGGEVHLGPASGADASTQAVRVGAAASKLLISGKITDNGLGRDLAIRSADSGRQVILSNTSNSYRATYVVIGDLLLGASQALPQNSALHLGNNSGWGTTVFDLNGFNQTLPQITALGTDGVTRKITNRSSTASTLTWKVANGETQVFGSPTLTKTTIEGNLNLTKTETGILELAGANTYTGLTTVSQGTLLVSHAQGLGSGGTAGNGSIVSSNAHLALKGNITLANEHLTIVGNGGSGGYGALRTSGLTDERAIWNGELFLGADSGGDPHVGAPRIGSNGPVLEISGRIHDNGLGRDLGIRSNQGAHTVVISGSTNSYRDTYLVIGRLHLGANNALSTGKLTLGNIANSGTQVFDLQGYHQTLSGLSSLGNASAVNRVNNTAVTKSTLTLNVASGQSHAFNSSGYTNNYVTGNLDLIKTGLGTQSFGGVLSHTGKTEIQAGTLALVGSDSASTTAGTITASSEIAIASGAILDLLGLGNQTLSTSASMKVSGQGETRGNLQVLGTLSPGSTTTPSGTLAVKGNLSTASSTTLNWDLGSPGLASHDKVETTGSLSLQGTLQLQAQVGFGVGSYTLFTYGSTQSNNLSLQNTPASYVATLDDTTPNQIRLKVSLASGWQIWDGSASDPVSIEGGAGTWSNTPTFTNWTDATSTYASAWDSTGQHGARFTTLGGQVTLAAGQAIQAKGLVFEVDGYHLLPGDASSSLQLVSNSKIEVFGGATATISAPITGASLIKAQGGTLILLGQNTYGNTTIEQGTLEIGEGGSLGSGPVVNQATIAFSPTSELRISNQISGSGDLVQKGSGTSILLTDHTYTGTTTIQSGTLQLGDGGTSGSIASTSIINDGTLAIRRSDAVVLNQTISGSGRVSQRGSGTVTLQGPLSYTGSTEVQNGSVLRFESNTSNLGGEIQVLGQVEFAQASDSAFKQTLSGSGNVIQAGSARLDLTQATLAHTGNTIARSGTLATGSMSQAVLQLYTGSVYQPAGNVAGTVNVKQLQLLGGTLQWDVSSSQSDRIRSTLPATLAAKTTVAFSSPVTQDGIYRLIENVDAAWNLSLLNASQYGSDLSPRFYLNGTDLYFSATRPGGGDWVSGDTLQNSNPTSTAASSGFRVIGSVSTGQAHENNVIRELSFAADSQLHVHQTLTVTEGNFTVAEGDATVIGDQIRTPQDFNKLGAGTLILRNSRTDIAGHLNLQAGTLDLSRAVDIGDELHLSQNTTLHLRGTAQVQASGPAHLAGQMILDGSLQTPSLQIAPSGRLSGHGTVVGNLHNLGQIAPGSSPGTLKVTGDFTQGDSGRLSMEIAGRRNLDQLHVDGTARLGGRLEVSAIEAHALQLGDRYTLIKAGKLKGHFDQVFLLDQPALRARFLKDQGDGIVLIAPQSYQALARSTAQRKIAQSLDSWLVESDESKEEVTQALDELRAEEYPAAFESMQPRFQASALEIGREMSHQHHQTLHQHLSSRRLGQRVAAVQVSGEENSEERGLGSRSGKAFGLKTSVLPYQETRDRWDVWVQNSGTFSSRGMSLTPGEDWESGSLLLGVDYAITDHFGVGIYASYQAGRGDFDHGGDIDLENARLGLYATYDRGGFYWNAALGLGQTQFDIKRPIRFGNLSKNAYSEPDGFEWSAMLGGGYDFEFGKWTLGPQWSVAYQQLHLGAYDERGAGALNLRVQESRLESLRSYLGARVAYTLQANDKLTFFPEVRAFWQHEYLGNNEVNSRFANQSGPEWTYAVDSQNPDSVFLGAGFSWMYGSKFGGNLFYHASFGRNDDVTHTFSLTGNWKF